MLHFPLTTKFLAKAQFRNLLLDRRECHSKPIKKLRSYFVVKFMEYMKSYEAVLEKRFPTALHIYRIFSVGVKDFKSDLFFYFQVFKKVNMTGQTGNLTLQEIEIYNKMPQDIKRVAPILILSSLPFCGFIFPIAYFFPKQLLSSHFWSLQQRNEFALQDHRNKLVHYRPVFRCLQGQLRTLKQLEVHKRWSAVLGLLGSGVHPTSQQILECRSLFEGAPYGIRTLPTYHVSHLLRIHGIGRSIIGRLQLIERGRLLRQLDQAMRQEGGPHLLSADQLRNACFFRGFNPITVPQTEAIDWLNTWLAVSQHVDDDSISLLLHTPVLLGYNQPSNWLLLHDQR